jgi:hypothetical protein
MKQLIFPASWDQLELVPSARSDLIESVSDIARWNEHLSPVRLRGVDDLIGFLFDTYCLEEGADQWVGQLIFPDEAAPLQKLIEMFWAFIQDWQKDDKYLVRLHQATLPEEVVSRAKSVEAVLKRRGVPTYVEQETP